jgi:septum formation protein
MPGMPGMQDTPGAPGVFEAARPLVLASGSPRRSEMLAGLGLRFEVLPCPEPEPVPLPGETAEVYALRASRAKAVAVAALRPDAVVLGADTVVVLGEEIMGKPADPDEAMLMLTRLVGATHRVVSGCVLVQPGGGVTEFAVSTEVTMGPQPLGAIMAYVATGEPMDKAGAYAIQGRGGFLVERIHGSYTNVVGLPLAETVDALLACGAVAPAPL